MSTMQQSSTSKTNLQRYYTSVVELSDVAPLHLPTSARSSAPPCFRPTANLVGYDFFDFATGAKGYVTYGGENRTVSYQPLGPRHENDNIDAVSITGSAGTTTVGSLLTSVAASPPPSPTLESAYRPIRTSELTSWSHSRRKYLPWAALALALLLALILGAVLGIRASHTHSKDSSGIATATIPPGSTTSSSTSDSTSPGAYPGTSLSLAFNSSSSLGYLWFQNSNLSLVFLTWSYDPTAPSLSFHHSDLYLGIEQAKGTSLCGRIFPDNSALQLIYVASNNSICDVWRNNSVDLAWYHGSLGGYGFKSIVGGARVAMDYQASTLYGNTDAGGGRLYVGGMDDRLHCCAYDTATQSWWQSTQNYNELSGHGGAAAFTQTSDGSGSVNGTTLFGIDKGNNQLTYRTQASNGLRAWPFGSDWTTESEIGNTTVQGNTTFALSWPVLYYEAASGTLGVKTLSDTTAENYSFSTALDGMAILRGTDVAVTQVEGGSYTVLAYQDNPTSIAWMVLRQGWSVVSQGHFVWNQDSWQWEDAPTPRNT